MRSLNASVLVWPDCQEVERALRQWVHRCVHGRHDVLRVGYFGSYARNDWGVGSDLDLLILLKDSELPFIRRAAGWDILDLPVPTDVVVYTEREWEALRRCQARITQQESCWVYEQTL
ncbi:MAG: nucleotidyltransferase domain-containing protein [Anaerolineae bacterium]|nr:nucleotidyltransferase domain-containing protein [Anaerolineae bacterium]